MSGARVVVAFTAEHLSAARDHLDQLNWRDSIDLRPAARSLAELEQIRDDITARRNELREQGVDVRLLSPSERDNTVRVGVASSAKHARTTLARYGDAIQVTGELGRRPVRRNSR